MSLSIGDFDLLTFFLCFSFLFSCIICPEPKAGRYFQRLWGSPALHLLWEIAGIIIWEEYPSGVSGRVQSVTTCCCFTFFIIIFFLFCLYYHSYGLIYKNPRSAPSRYTSRLLKFRIFPPIRASWLLTRVTRDFDFVVPRFVPGRGKNVKNVTHHTLSTL